MNDSQAMRVAIVDDDESFNRALARLLRLSGFNAASFLSPNDFLDSPRRNEFDCLILDIQLSSEMSGFELHRQLQGHGSGTPVIYLTAQDDPATEETAIQLLCARFLRKRDVAASIVETLRELERTTGFQNHATEKAG